MRRAPRKFLNNKVFNKLPLFTSMLIIVLNCIEAYTQVEYILDENCVGISEGYITSCNCSNNDYIKLVIPETLSGQTVRGIADNPVGNYPVFHLLTNIADIEFPNTLEYIGDNVNIYIPYQVKTIDFPESLRYIGDHAFGSSGIDSIIFPNNLEHIGTKAFNWCYLKNIFIPNSVTYIGFGAFNGNNISQINGEASNGIIYARKTDGTINYQQIVSYGGANKNVDFIPDSVKFLSDNSFDGCYIGSVKLPDSLKSIGSYAFRSNGLTNINIPSGVQYIGDFAFNVNSLESVFIPDTLYHLGAAAFNRNRIEEVNGQQNKGLFYARNSLGLESYDTVVSYGGLIDTIDFIPTTVTHIGKFTFDYQKIKSIKLPTGIEYIGDYSLRGNYLDTIQLPESVSYIGINALYGNDFSEFILPVSNTHELQYWIDNDSVKYNGGDTISIMYRTYTAVLGDLLNHLCDSVVYGTLNQVTCNTFISPSSKYIWTQSGKYTDTIPSSLGCDSIITINLIINNLTTSSITETVCDSYASPSGKVWTVSDTYLDTIPNAVGCDSIITIYLTVNSSSTSSIAETVCNTYTSPSGKVWTDSDTYMDTIPNSAGCDSIITIDLTINHSSTSSISVTSCDSYTSPSGKVWTDSDTYMDTIPNSAGCDSIITIDLTIDCSNSISSNYLLKSSLYPNPAEERVTINFKELNNSIQVEIFRLSGQLIKSKMYYDSKLISIDLNLPKEAYLIKVTNEDGKSNLFKVLKQ